MNADISKLPLRSLNPFMPGADKQPTELVGRTHDLELMDRMIARTKLGLLDRGVVYLSLIHISEPTRP